MTDVSLYGGPLKRDLIQTAFEICGQAGYEFELTPEEYESALRRLNGLMYEWQGRGITTGFNFPVANSLGSPEEESGLAWEDQEATSQTLARRMAPSIGKNLGDQAKAEYKGTMDAFFARHITLMPSEMGRQTPRGQGNRYWNGPRPYFVAPVSTDEVQQ